eukprot:CAMPEP_0184502422 /NCGR_PEP_ID=MMETSP0113_2-20130426/50305_1 /TAXON_ID=91329 /ORGANISM="Norrisiella sphaerica, Strain BC52" /LENGTH=587 /DNA_ID=CAMNT_0026891593 /DNA_START=176 /DNA_END=1936 /DNA_ORIENTATION=+
MTLRARTSSALLASAITRDDAGPNANKRSSLAGDHTDAKNMLAPQVPRREPTQHKATNPLPGSRKTPKSQLPSERENMYELLGAPPPDPEVNAEHDIQWGIFGLQKNGDRADPRNLPIAREYRDFLHCEQKIIAEAEHGEICRCRLREIKHLVYIEREWSGCNNATAHLFGVRVGDWRDRFFGFRETNSLHIPAKTAEKEEETYEYEYYYSSDDDADENDSKNKGKRTSNDPSSVSDSRQEERAAPKPEKKSDTGLVSTRSRYKEEGCPLRNFRYFEFATIPEAKTCTAAAPQQSSHNASSDYHMRIGIYEGEDDFLAPQGSKIWAGGLVLSWFLTHNPQLVRNKSVLDAGSGTGIVGIVAGSLGAEHVELSECEEGLRDILEKNVGVNRYIIDSEKVSISLSDCSEGTTKFDVVLLGEMAFNSGGGFGEILDRLKPGGILLMTSDKQAILNDILKFLHFSGEIFVLMDISFLSACSTKTSHRCRANTVLVGFQKQLEGAKRSHVPKEPLPDILEPIPDQVTFPDHNMPDIIQRLWRLAVPNDQFGSSREGARAPYVRPRRSLDLTARPDAGDQQESEIMDAVYEAL